MKRFLNVVMIILLLIAVLTSCSSNKVVNAPSQGSSVPTTTAPTTSPTNAPTNAPTVISKLKIGDYVQMGKYYDEPILWRCVDIDANGPLMLSDRILTLKPFDAAGEHKYLDGTLQKDYESDRKNKGSNLWETSNMRAWLNSSAITGNVIWPDGCPPTKDKVEAGYNGYANEKGFLADGNFTETERGAILEITQKSLLYKLDVSKLSLGGTGEYIFGSNISSIVKNFDTAYYHNLNEKMFLLDVKQENKVFLNSSTLGTNYYIGKPTQKAVDNSEFKDARLIPENNCFSRLRSPDAGSASDVIVIDPEGRVGSNSVSTGLIGARPAFYIDLTSAILKSGTGTESDPFVV